MDAEIVWAKLADAGWVRGEMPAAGEPPAPWYLRAMIGVAAWIAAAFVLSSVGALVYRVFDSAVLSIIAGSILCAIAATMMHRSREGLFLRQFGLALALTSSAANAQQSQGQMQQRPAYNQMPSSRPNPQPTYQPPTAPTQTQRTTPPPAVSQPPESTPPQTASSMEKNFPSASSANHCRSSRCC